MRREDIGVFKDLVLDELAIDALENEQQLSHDGVFSDVAQRTFLEPHGAQVLQLPLAGALFFGRLLHANVLLALVAVASLVADLAGEHRFNYAALNLGDFLVVRQLKQEVEHCGLVFNAFGSLELAVELFKALLFLLKSASLWFRL